jgi:crotonobetainyl-CoA:carnitine CoA-transferase CaiB-like acyl-CoA transferase
MPVPRASAALTRFTVLDLTRVRAGPTAVAQLADWGANVIKVELPEHQEPADAMGGPAPRPPISRTCTATSARSPSISSRRTAPPCSAGWRQRPT